MKQEHDLSHITCASLRDLIPAVSSKWAMVIVAQLVERPQRFSDLKRALGDVTQKSLTAALRDLERDGFIARVVTPTIPPRVDYTLTQMGHSALEPAREVARWAVQHQVDIEQARERYSTKTE